MHGCWSIVALIGFGMQQFVCWPATCASSPATTIEQTPPAKTCCGHHHHAPDQPSEPESSHHLCVATHLFFIERVADAEIDPFGGPMLTADLPLCTRAVVAPREPLQRGSIDAEAWSPPAHARRSALGVWTL